MKNLIHVILLSSFASFAQAASEGVNYECRVQNSDGSIDKKKFQFFKNEKETILEWEVNNNTVVKMRGTMLGASKDNPKQSSFLLVRVRHRFPTFVSEVRSSEAYPQYIAVGDDYPIKDGVICEVVK